MIRAALLLALVAATHAGALDLALSGAAVEATDTTEAGSVRLPDGPWQADAPAREVEGAITRTVLRTQGGSRTTLQLLAPLRDQLGNAGYTTTFACADRACGGFDFRFGLDLLEAPAMFVDLGNYRYLLMEKPGAEPHTVSILTSRSTGAGFVHITTVSEPVLDEAGEEAPAISTVASPAPDTAVSALVENGHTILGDLDFASGAATLAGETYPSLDALAEWLEDAPTARIALVGHTDSVGGQAANQALSRARAQAVRTRLIEDHGIAPDRLEAEGVGYLAPIAPNATPEGRALNRRVEAVLLSAE